eukprot:1865326-Ditylum_brightwellii.AAC.1
MEDMEGAFITCCISSGTVITMLIPLLFVCAFASVGEGVGAFIGGVETEEVGGACRTYCISSGSAGSVSTILASLSFRYSCSSAGDSVGGGVGEN